MFYTLKKVIDQPANRNSQNVKNERQIYCNWFIHDGVNDNLIFLDEMGCNLWTRRSYGRARRGEPCFRDVGNQRGRNQTLCMAINRNEGLIHFELLEGPMNVDRLTNFLQNMAANYNNVNATVIMDNARPHHGADVQVPQNFNIRFLPPYSPFLNPIENTFSVIKASIKRQLAQIRENEEEQARNEHLTLVAYRERKLRRIIINSLDEVTPELCNNEFNHVFRFIPRCIALEDMLF